MKSTEWPIIKSASEAKIPDPGFKIDSQTALVLIDPQNDFLHPDGVAYDLVKESLEKNNTIRNIVTLLKLWEENNMPVFVSPHWYFPTDYGWKFEGALEKLMHSMKMYDRKGILNTEGFEGSGADFLKEFKPFFSGKNVVICNPHKVYGPQNNDLALQLRKRGCNKVILSGMSANLCIESHLRHLLELGFEVCVCADATGSAILPGINTFEAALINFRMLSSHVFTTEELEQEVAAQIKRKEPAEVLTM